ncbi:MAG: hypothetical protein EBR82_38315 [Caulobacteraceae bacterium]|nr:hypothetical protein [Caulobacteraceae bacterium]
MNERIRRITTGIVPTGDKDSDNVLNKRGAVGQTQDAIRKYKLRDEHPHPWKRNFGQRHVKRKEDE